MRTSDGSREIITIEEYLSLSAKINYQLSARSLKKHVLMSLVLGQTNVTDRERSILVSAFDVLQAGYDQDRRRLGTPGILHPLRAAALLARTKDRPGLVDLLTAFLHDKDEDLTEEELGSDRFRRMEDRYQDLLNLLDTHEREGLIKRIHVLSNKVGTYQTYLGDVLDVANEMPDLLHVKLSDRIDNTFDVHLQHPGVTNYNFYRAIFDILFLPNFRGVQMGQFHFMPDTSEGVMLLSQLFKNTILLALLRSQKLDQLDHTTRRLFVGLAVAGIREAQWLALEMFNTCFADVREQRDVLVEVMNYCASGGVNSVRTRDAGGALDGMFLASFTASQSGQQKRMLTELFENKELLIRMVLAFIVVFASFINDPDYTLQGIDRLGVSPVSSH